MRPLALPRFVLTVLLVIGAGRVTAEDVAPREVPITWTLSLEDAGAVASLVVDGEKRVVAGDDVRGVPVLVLVGIVSLPPLVDALIALYRDLAVGGVVIDTRNGALDIRTERNLPYGVMILRGDGGAEVATFRATPAAPDLSAAIAALVGTLKPETKQ